MTECEVCKRRAMIAEVRRGERKKKKTATVNVRGEMKLKFKTDAVDDVVFVTNNKSDLLGSIEWSKDWKCYVWYQQHDIMMSSDCLQQVVNKLKELDKNPIALKEEK